MYLVKNPVTYCIYLKPICACFTSNIFGRRPVDYAETEAIKLALLQAQKNKEPLVKLPCSGVSNKICRVVGDFCHCFPCMGTRLGFFFFLFKPSLAEPSYSYCIVIALSPLYIVSCWANCWRHILYILYNNSNLYVCAMPCSIVHTLCLKVICALSMQGKAKDSLNCRPHPLFLTQKCLK